MEEGDIELFVKENLNTTKSLQAKIRNLEIIVNKQQEELDKVKLKQSFENISEAILKK